MTGLLLRFPTKLKRSTGMEPVILLLPHQRTAWQCLGFDDLLNDWERDFLSNLRGKRLISDREQNCLNGIASKIEVKRK